MKRIFVAAWSYPPKMSGESVVCKRTLENSEFSYDVCSCMQEIDNHYSDKVRVFPVAGKYISWPFRVARYFLKLDKREHYDIIMTRVMPPFGHLVGLLIKFFKPKIKWVVYFSDPIWNSPFISLSSLFRKNTKQQPNYVLMKVFGVVAWIGVQLGDLLVFNNDRLAKYVLGKQYKYYKNKIVIAPYGHVGVHFQEESQRQSSDKIVITHVGQIYGARSLGNLVKALEILKQSYPQKYKRLKIVQVGFICDYEKNLIAVSSVAESFEFVNEVNYEQSLDYMRIADYALILDPDFVEKSKNMYVPVKIFDYMSVGAEVLAIADRDSATADIAGVLGCAIAGHQVDEIAQLLLACTEGAIGSHKDISNCFHCLRGVEALDARLKQLLQD